jgi:hypothetical protein
MENKYRYYKWNLCSREVKNIYRVSITNKKEKPEFYVLDSGNGKSFWVRSDRYTRKNIKSTNDMIRII